MDVSGKYELASIKANGKTHVRKDELKAYRETIAAANKNMINAVIAKDYEAADRWSRMIDNTQGKILEIINQEDGHNYKQIDNYEKIAKTTMTTVGQMANTAGQIADTANKLFLVA